MLEPTDLEGVDDSLARRILAIARSIAPGLDNIIDVDGGPQPRSDAIAILIGVAGVVAPRGSLLIKQQVMGPARVTYTEASSWFSDDDRAALRACVTPGGPPTFGPLGSFPFPDRTVELAFREPVYRPFQESH